MPLLTPETSRKYAAKSLATRRANREARLAMEAMPETMEEVKELVEKTIESTPKPVVEKPIEPEDKVYRFFDLRRACVRKQLLKIDAMILKEQDPQKLDRLASANAKLSDLERVMSGRPLPGQLRPRASKSLKSDPSDVVPE